MQKVLTTEFTLSFTKIPQFTVRAKRTGELTVTEYLRNGHPVKLPEWAKVEARKCVAADFEKQEQEQGQLQPA